MVTFSRRVLVGSLLLLGVFTVGIFPGVAGDSLATKVNKQLFFDAVENGDLAAVQKALDEGADVTWTDVFGGPTARSIAHSKTPYFGRNVYNDIQDLLDTAIEKLEKGKSEEEQKKIDQLLAGPSHALLMYSVEVPQNCNLTMAKLALQNEPNLNLKIPNAAGHSAQEIAERKSGTQGTFDWDENDCARIARFLECKQHERDEVAAEHRLKAKQEEDERSYPALKLLRNSLSHFVGLDPLREKFSSMIKTDAMRRRNNPHKCDKPGQHNEAWVLMGSPGTGKTSIARLITPVLHAAGMVTKDYFRELTKGDLKGTHVGEASDKTEAAIEAARGGVLFLDEAYTYKVNDQYEANIIETFLQALTANVDCDDRIIFIFAGYKHEMEEWLKTSNQGFASRIKQRFEIPPLRSSSLAAIFQYKMEQNERLVIDADPTHFQHAMTAMIESGTTHEQRTEHGGRVAERLVEYAYELHVDSNPVVSHVLSQEIICKAVQGLSREKFNDMDFSQEVECTLVPQHPSLPNAPNAKPPQPVDDKDRRQKQKKEKKKEEQRKKKEETRKTEKRVLHKPKPAPQTSLVQMMEYLSQVFVQATAFAAAKGLLFSIVFYAIVYLACGASVGAVLVSVWNLVAFIVKFAYWLFKKMLSLLRRLWNKLMDCCGNKSKKFEDTGDPDTTPYECARDCIKHGGTIRDAMLLLWNRVPMDTALHGKEIVENLTQLKTFFQEDVAPVLEK